MTSIRLLGTFTLRSPLSHIGETISTTAYLCEEPILQPDGSVELVFAYSGNAWRGQLRDLAAAYMLDRLGHATVPLDVFHLLFSGGRIGGDQVVDLAAARRMRQLIPMLALWGGGVGNQILSGKMRVGTCYPLCSEALVALPQEHHAEAVDRHYRAMTLERSYSRRDDAKIDTVAGYLDAPPVQAALLDGKPGKARKSEPAAADQMRMTVELMAAGVRLATQIDVLDASEVELGALVSALHRFSLSPYIGGQSGKGHGLVALEYRWLDLNTGETGPFLCVSDSPIQLAPKAEEAKARYDAHLAELYKQALDANSSEIKAIFGARAA